MAIKIKFKAIIKNTEDSYAYGYYYERDGKSYIVDSENEVYEVEPDTVSMFTGVIKNGVIELYENDLIEIKTHSGNEYRGVINWEAPSFQADFYDPNKDEIFTLDLETICDKIEVVGNVKDLIAKSKSN